VDVSGSIPLEIVNSLFLQSLIIQNTNLGGQLPSQLFGEHRSLSQLCESSNVPMILYLQTHNSLYL
jgi:hypothetical protein